VRDLICDTNYTYPTVKTGYTREVYVVFERMRLRCEYCMPIDVADIVNFYLLTVKWCDLCKKTRQWCRN